MVVAGFDRLIGFHSAISYSVYRSLHSVLAKRGVCDLVRAYLSLREDGI